MLLERMTWPQVKALDIGRLIVLCPLGSFEQHGPHLPLTTDTDIVTAIARRVSEARPATVLCAPTLWTGHSTHHLSFPGTISIRQMHYVTEFHEISDSGTVGHPDLASAEKGKLFLDGIVQEVGAFVDDFLTW